MERGRAGQVVFDHERGCGWRREAIGRLPGSLLGSACQVANETMTLRWGSPAGSSPSLSTSVTDLVRQAQWLMEPPSCYHWRRSNRDEVDLVLESSDGRAICVEVKVAENIDVPDFRGIDAFREHHPNAFYRGFVFYSGENVQPFGRNRWAIPFGALGPDGADQRVNPMARVIEAVGSRFAFANPYPLLLGGGT